MAPIRVLIVDLPGMLEEIVAKSFAEHEDIEVVTAESGEQRLGELVSQAEADVLVVSSRHRELALVDRPQLRLIAIRPDARDARLLEMKPRRTTFDDPWMDQLVAAIRGTPPATATP